MIFNAFSVVAAFAALLRTALGLVVVVVGARALRSARRGGEEHFYLLVALCVTLVGLGVVSWPLLYLVLDSYVPANGGPPWPGVMCAQGVTRIGTDSIGPAAFLPRLLGILAVTKPLLVFVSGVWLVLHLVNRRGRTGALAPRVLVALGACGLVAVADGAAEIAYLVIPKQEKFLAAGCCATPLPAEAPPPPAAGPAGRTVTGAFLGVGGALVLVLSAAIRRGGAWLLLSLPLALLSLPLGFVFLGNVAAPTFLHLPYHRCAYCLALWMPETLVGIALYVLGAFSVGWAFSARLGGMGGGAGEGVALLRMARFGYLGSLLMASVMLVSS